MSRGKKITIRTLLDMKAKGEKIAMLTAYDYQMALLEDQAGIEIILIGDSLGMVVLGYENTLPVTVEEVIHHLKAVTRAKPRALVVGDLPFMSYQASMEDAVRNAGRMVKEGGAEAVKLEGGRRMGPVIKAIRDADIPVMGHIGLTPQSVHQFGGYRVQGKDPKGAEQLCDDAKFLEDVGCFSVVLEGIPWRLAEKITGSVSIPTIGIGAGIHCDGQVLVVNDMLGMLDEAAPRFVKRYAETGRVIVDAVSEYVRDIKEGRFPDLDHSYSDEKR
ncbi:MAG: 3-methyl-2-oxobutanoate hydroxymethyltransferase [Candidatus Latescibacteria bacterium]|nr:3-methyl-2-oxobutanoate hydroxymethyltransferase [Candidatus Latescibacterota bacterium]NIM21038.1 3-methyl-2-oxobutanoate hydroxymethyltransferase [Candidatus Latescibacterota bacterium]NIM65173.1 3-methyl-2-oxobutanoate hydroxymethyltransferase [Candidatus Latescibacterota bacterium]NIO01688.1 3-methyl-2-oxobutanoate hydroxymethyltransferase [Candidatus Latescibacterota bacterium]NIO28205.1 3-methyl-2-oxobutanoate hydroxymethyltransferase [Candidatus Latescibacterota bacterium]